MHHPHVHCVVPAGGIGNESGRWVKCRPGFFLPVRVLARLYRGKLLALLSTAYDRGQLCVHGDLQRLSRPAAFRALIREVRGQEWVVYAKPPFGGAGAVLKYLARYTHRIAISNHRLISADDSHVSFRWKDYRHGHRQRVMRLDLAEFARRFLLHVLPRGFVKIRYCGYLAQSRRGSELPICRELLGTPPPIALPEETGAAPDGYPGESTATERPCPACRTGRLTYQRALPPPDTS
jgi:hypothetical protein